jgi:hypothetical protein
MSLFTVDPQAISNFHLAGRVANGEVAVYPEALKVFQNDISLSLAQIEQIVARLSSDPVFLAGLLNGQNQLGATASKQVVSTNAAVTANQTVNCAGASTVFVSYTLTGAINLSVALTNLDAGANVFVRTLNSSGAARTITYSASAPSAAAYSVVANLSAGVANWSSGVSVAAGAYAVISGLAALASGIYLLYGIGTNG